MGDRPAAEQQVYVTVYRRPLADGDGFKALFVIMNESFDPVELPLRILDPQRVLGGPNTLKAGEILSRTTPADPR